MSLRLNKYFVTVQPRIKFFKVTKEKTLTTQS